MISPSVFACAVRRPVHPYHCPCFEHGSLNPLLGPAAAAAARRRPPPPPRRPAAAPSPLRNRERRAWAAHYAIACYEPPARSGSRTGVQIMQPAAPPWTSSVRGCVARRQPPFVRSVQLPMLCCRRVCARPPLTGWPLPWLHAPRRIKSDRSHSNNSSDIAGASGQRPAPQTVRADRRARMGATRMTLGRAPPALAPPPHHEQTPPRLAPLASCPPAVGPAPLYTPVPAPPPPAASTLCARPTARNRGLPLNGPFAAAGSPCLRGPVPAARAARAKPRPQSVTPSALSARTRREERRGPA
jgi:hypothetical protein